MGVLLKLLPLSFVGMLSFTPAAPAQTFGGPPGDPLFHGGSGGNLFKRGCERGMDWYLAGVTVRTGAWVDAIRPECARFNPQTRTLDKEFQSGDFAGGPGGNPQSARCRPDEYVAGLKIGFTRDGNKPKFLDFVELICSPIDGSGENRRCLQTGNGCWDKHPDPGPYNGYGLSFDMRCPNGLYAAGLSGRSGRYVDAVGLSCGGIPARPSASGVPPVK